MARIRVTLKPTVLDPQGAAVRKALASLGFTGVEDVRMGKYVELKLAARDRAAAEQAVAKACQDLLANPVIEEYAYTLEEVGG